MPIPKDFDFPLPELDTSAADSTVGGHQTHIMCAGIDYFVPDDEVQSIKEGAGKALCVWGLVSYEDIFGKPHAVKFGQILTWLPNNTVFVYYLSGQNDGD